MLDSPNKNPKIKLLLPIYCYYRLSPRLACLTLTLTVSLYCTVKEPKYAPVTSMIGLRFLEPDLVVTSGGTLNCGVDVTLNGGYFGTVH